MAIGLTDDQRALADTIGDWARDTDTVALVRRAEGCWTALSQLGVVSVALPENVGGAGGTMVDLACALEACPRGMVPGPVLSTSVAATLIAEHPDTPLAKQILPAIADGSASVALAPDVGALAVTETEDGVILDGVIDVVWDAGATTHLLLGTGGDEPAGSERWFLLDAETTGVEVEPAERVDLSRGAGTVRLSRVHAGANESVRGLSRDRVRDVAVTLAAAEMAGVARWCLETAVQYAGVREQFGRKIGSFQAIKHLCGQMLEAAECATAAAWDAARAYADPGDEQFSLAAAIAGAVALDAAVDNAKECIQVLGGIGFTWEHDAHLFLRRALVTRQLLGGTDQWRTRSARLAVAGARRRVQIDLEGQGEDTRAQVRERLQTVVALRPADRRTALADAGLISAHWPTPYGLGASPVEQLVIDQELAAAGIHRPELAIGAWAAPTILKHGSDGQRERFVPATLRGEIAWCQLFSEPGAGSDLAALRTKATRVEGGWKLSGQKVWTSLAAEADWAICLARTNPDAPQHKGISYFLVDMSSDGIDVRPLRELTGEAVFNEVFLDDVFVPDECVVGDVDGGWKLARTTLANERVAMSGSSLGVSVERALELSDDGGLDPAVFARLGKAVADASTVTTLGLRSTLRSIAGEGPGAESSVQKLVGVRQRQDAAELVVEMLGPKAVLGGDIASKAMQELLLTRCLSIAGGTTQILRNVVGERILGLPRDS